MANIEDEVHDLIVEHLTDEAENPVLAANRISREVSNAFISAADALDHQGDDEKVVKNVRKVGSKLGGSLYR